ncbi:helix-turn-helix transcriptional regulator [Psychrobacter lutiphocae]|uniref:helix-turn-helix transcriptional regulator n=1 Tax=Psychrobacter lutiphocae TaxID=540500 RepID=UPI00037B974A|nr:helix-turn-helix transcriptional regulator [Psychrobacter lutiphocae]
MYTNQNNLVSELAVNLQHGRQRASRAPVAMPASARTQARDIVIEQLFAGRISQGEALKALRVQVLNVKQDKFAQMVKVSRKTLSDIENDKGNYSMDTLNQVFRPFGLKVGLVPISPPK